MTPPEIVSIDLPYMQVIVDTVPEESQERVCFGLRVVSRACAEEEDYTAVAVAAPVEVVAGKWLAEPGPAATKPEYSEASPKATMPLQEARAAEVATCAVFELLLVVAAVAGAEGHMRTDLEMP